MNTSKQHFPVRMGDFLGCTGCSDKAAHPACIWETCFFFFLIFFLVYNTAVTPLLPKSFQAYCANMELCYSWAEPLQNIGLWRARYVGLLSPSWLWMSTLTINRRQACIAFSWHWGEHSKPEYLSVQLKACIWEEVSHCCTLLLSVA